MSGTQIRTAPPVRLRMIGADLLCPRSMTVQWEDGTAVGRQSWCSWTDGGDSCSSFEAELLLPSSVTDVSVSFQVRMPGCAPKQVNRVDPWSRHIWMKCDGKFLEEVLWFRVGRDDFAEIIDMTFVLTGPAHACYLLRSWNATGSDTHKPWEFWPDDETKPQPEEPATLEAADGAAPIAVGLGNPKLHYICTAKRMCAAARALLEVHRKTLEELRSLDKRFTGQWVGTNVGNTTSASLGIASAAFLFFAPPVAIGLGVGSAVTGGVTMGADAVADSVNHASLRRQLANDAWNSFVVSELVREWVHARETLGASSKAIALAGMAGSRSQLTLGEEGIPLGDVVDGALVTGSVSSMSANAATRVMSTMGQQVAMASQVLGIAGALLSTGIAIRGWSSTKAGQTDLREQATELRLRILRIQHLLSAVDRLECPVCADEVILADEVRRCTCMLHCFHVACVQGQQVCPLCGSDLEPNSHEMVESAQRFARDMKSKSERPSFMSRAFGRRNNMLADGAAG